MKEFLSTIASMFVAMLRLILLTIIFFLSGIHKILFSRIEICAVELKGVSLRCDQKNAKDRLSYIDKLCCENPSLLMPDTDVPIPEDEFPKDFPDDEDDEGQLR